MTVAVCEREPRNAYKVQVDGVRVLARACKEFDVRLIHLSSDMVYSGNKGAPYTLDDVPDPISVYGKTKWEGERALQEVQGDYVIVRSAIVLGRGRFRKTGFLDWMVERAQKDEELPLYVDQWRSPIVVDDLVEVIFKLASSSFCGVLLAGGEEGINRVEMGKRLLVAMGKPHDIIRPVSVDSIESGVSLQKDLRLDNSKLKEVVGKEKFMGIGEYFRRCEIID
jgi:dTDP-4-dehydrorhamnose reductase